MPPVLHGQAEARGHRRPRRALPAPLRGPQVQAALTALDPQRRARLLVTKLQALVRSQWGDPALEGATVHQPPFGAILRRGAEAWVLSGASGPIPLGGALAWSIARGAQRLHLLTDADRDVAGAAARRAAEFAMSVEVWRVEGAGLAPVEPLLPHLDPPVAPAVWDRFAEPLREAGAEVVAEGGMLRAEVRGLEVARVVEGPTGEPRLEVGVGRHDRDAHTLLRPEPTMADVEAVVETVRAGRRAGAPVSPANQLSLERWLRTVVVADPSMVGAAGLEPAPSPVERTDLRRRAPAPATGFDDDGGRVVVVCSVGVDPELVPLAADARLTAATRWGLSTADVRLRLVVPEGDDHPVTRQLAAGLARPAEVVAIGADWRHR